MSDSLNSLAQSDETMPELPSGNMLTGGPTPSLGVPGGGLLGSLANAAQSAIGYATKDPALQNQAIQRENQQAQYRLLLPVGQALADAQAKLAAGDLPGATAAYQRIGHLSMAFPAVRDFGTKLAEQSMVLRQRQASGDVLDKLDPLAGAFARTGGDPKEALNIAKYVREGGEWSPVQNPGTGETQYVSKYRKNPDGSPVVFGVVNGLIKINPGETLAKTSTDAATGKTTVSPAYVAPVSQYAKSAPAGVQEQLDVPEYDRLRQQELNGMPEAGQLADKMYLQAQARHLASQNPEELKLAASQTGVDPVAARRGELSKADADALAQRIDARKNAQITLNADTTTRARLSVDPDTRILVKRDGSGQTLSGVDKITAAQMIASGQVAPLTPDAQKQLELTQTLRPQIQTLNELATRLYPLQKEQPGLTVVQAIKLAVDRHLMSGDEARVYSGALAAVSTGMSRVETGTVRPGQQTQEWFRTKVLPGDAESLTSVVAKLREANKMIDNRIDALSQTKLRHTSTNPFNDPDIKRIQNGERPTGVDDNGIFQFPEPITTSGGLKIRGR